MHFFVFVAASAGVFTLVIVGLVLMLLVARKQLVAEGEVTITINDDPANTLRVAPGQSLLSALASQRVFLPSACGGGGTCAMCRCQVLEGGGDILPTETGMIPLSQRKEHWRLGCQVKVKQDLKIRVPEEIFGIRKWECEVVSNRNVATFIKEFVVRLPPGERMSFDPGGYVQIDVPRYQCTFRDFDIDERFRDEWDRFKLWDTRAGNAEEGVYRAYSMANHPAEGDIVMLNIRIATAPRGLDVPPGVCSSYIFSRKPGDKVMVSGPYGEFHINRTKREMVYVGGGAGMAPLRSHLFHLFHTEHTRDRKVSYWYGARSLREMFYWDDFQKIEAEYPNFSFHLALSEPQPEDDWTGSVGFIHQVLLDEYLSTHEAPEDCEYYLCGPPLMLSAVQRMLDDLGVPKENVRFDDFGS